MPFLLALDSSKLRKLAEDAALNMEEVFFLQKSADLIKTRSKYYLQHFRICPLTVLGSLMTKVREESAFGDDLFWISQLYAKDWEPGTTA